MPDRYLNDLRNAEIKVFFCDQVEFPDYPGMNSNCSGVRAVLER